MKMESVLKILSLLVIILVLIACGDANQVSQEETNRGAISFSVTWVDAPTLSSSNGAQIRALDCDASGIATVSFEVLDENNSQLAYNEFDCSVHNGRVDDITPGINRTLIVRGLNFGGDEIFFGTVTGITVELGNVTNIGEVECFPCQIWYGLVAHYPFDGNAIDVTGNANDGTVTGATLTTDRFGNGDSAYSFDGSGSYISAIDAYSLDGMEAMTVSFWINPTNNMNNLSSRQDFLYKPYHTATAGSSWSIIYASRRADV